MFPKKNKKIFLTENRNNKIWNVIAKCCDIFAKFDWFEVFVAGGEQLWFTRNKSLF